MENGTLRCYHHCNCSDRPAVATCSNCGKGLCVECADKLRSKTTGKILCVDCLNAELQENAAIARAAKHMVTKEIIFILLGLIVGIIGFVFIFKFVNDNIVKIISLWLPFGLASLWTILRFIAEREWDHFFPKLILFIILVAVSPLMFLWRVIRRIIDIASMKRFAKAQIVLQNANNEYFELARSMNNKLDDAETYRRKLEAQYADLLKANNAEAQRQIAELQAQHAEALQKEAETQAKLADMSNLLMIAQQTIDLNKSKVQAATRIRPERETTKVGSGRRAA